MKDSMFVGVDVGGTKIFAGLVEPSGTVTARRKAATPAKASGKEIIAAICGTINEMLDRSDVARKDLKGIGIGLPGIIDKDTGRVACTPNLNLGGVKILDELEKKFKVKIAAGNDVNMGILGEKWLGAARDSDDVVGMFMGTGLGGGVILDGKLETGYWGRAGELGHMVMQVDGPRCNCGNKGCLEAFVGRWAIERDIRQAIKSGEKSVIEKTASGRITKIKSKMLRAAIDGKDKVVTRVMKRVSEVMGHACVSLRHVFDPEMIVLGGGVIEACGGFVLPIVRKVVEADPYFAGTKGFRIVESQLGDDAVFLGAVALVQQSLGMGVSAGSPYPQIEYAGSGKLSVGGETASSTFFVRADGKVKGGKRASAIGADGKPLSEDDIELVCKKKPELLIVGYEGKKKPVLSDEARAAVKALGLELALKPVREAIKAFESSKKRKALLVILGG